MISPSRLRTVERAVGGLQVAQLTGRAAAGAIINDEQRADRLASLVSESERLARAGHTSATSEIVGRAERVAELVALGRERSLAAQAGA